VIAEASLSAKNKRLFKLVPVPNEFGTFAQLQTANNRQ